nr:PREDICTED: uncharacterized protein LOC102692653 [Lepisosteus oculatus]
MARGRGGDRGRGGARGNEDPRSSLPEKDTEEAEAETGPGAAPPAEGAREEEEGRRKTRAKKEWATAEPTVDSWALGVLVYCLLTGCFPWEQTCASDPLYRRYRRWFEAEEGGGRERASPGGRFYNPSAAEKRADSSTPVGGLPATEVGGERGRRRGDPEIEIVPPQFVGFTPLALALFRELLNPDPRRRGLPGEAERFLGEPWLRGRGAPEQGTRGGGEKEAGGQEGEVMGFSTGLRTGSKWSQQ